MSSTPIRFTEDSPLILPGLETEHKFGALWNCRSSQFLEDNLFGTNSSNLPTKEHLTYFPRKESIYSLNHVKSTKTKTLSTKICMNAMLEINVFVGKIKLNIGKDYKPNMNKKPLWLECSQLLTLKLMKILNRNSQMVSK